MVKGSELSGSFIDYLGMYGIELVGIWVWERRIACFRSVGTGDCKKKKKDKRRWLSIIGG